MQIALNPDLWPSGSLENLSPNLLLRLLTKTRQGLDHIENTHSTMQTALRKFLLMNKALHGLLRVTKPLIIYSAELIPKKLPIPLSSIKQTIDDISTLSHAQRDSDKEALLKPSVGYREAVSILKARIDDLKKIIALNASRR